MNRYVVERSLLENNIDILLKEFSSCKVRGVVKGNGYGLGMLPFAETLLEKGIRSFAVTMADDAAVLAANGFGQDILMLRSTDDPDELDTRFSRFTNGIEFDPKSGDMDEYAFDPEDSDLDDEDEEVEEEDGPEEDGAGDTEDPEGKLGPDGVQIQQGPEIRAEINIPKSSQINPQDIMHMIDSIVSGLAEKVGAKGTVSGSGAPVPPGMSGGAPGKKPQGAQPDPFALYEFRDLQSVVQAAKLVGPHYDSENILYKNPVNQRYYLYLGRERNSVEEFAQLCTIMNEFGSRCRTSYASKEYFEEHTVKVLEDALIQLEEL